MRKLISTLLLVATLFANLSWAADTDAEAFFGHGSEWSQDKSPAPDDHGNSDACDHCCHGSAHLSGLLQQSIVSLNSSASLHPVLPTQNYRTRTQSPPTPPPNA